MPLLPYHSAVVLLPGLTKHSCSCGILWHSRFLCCPKRMVPKQVLREKGGVKIGSADRDRRCRNSWRGARKMCCRNRSCPKQMVLPLYCSFHSRYFRDQLPLYICLKCFTKELVAQWVYAAPVIRTTLLVLFFKFKYMTCAAVTALHSALFGFQESTE